MKKYLFVLLIAISAICRAQDCSTASQYTLGGRFTVEIPDCMEMQDGSLKQASDAYQRQMGNNFSEKVVFQRKGMNDSYQTIRQPNYEKVLYTSHYAGSGNFKKLGSAFSASELTILSNDLKEGFQSSSSVTIISWDKPINVKVGNMWLAKISYVRKFAGNEAVRNSTYYIQDSDKLHSISLSYRVSQSAKWKPVMGKIILSLKNQ